MMVDAMDVWKNAVIDELVVLGILNDSHENDPRKAVQDIIKYNMEIALDPAVSEEARKLRDGEFVEVGHVRSKGLCEVDFHDRCPEVGYPLYLKKEHLDAPRG